MEEVAGGSHAERAEVEVTAAASVHRDIIIGAAQEVAVAAAVAHHPAADGLEEKRVLEVGEVRLLAPDARARRVHVELALRAMVERPASSLPAHMAHVIACHIRRCLQQQ